jgi:hypothetical protein
MPIDLLDEAPWNPAAIPSAHYRSRTERAPWTQYVMNFARRNSSQVATTPRQAFRGYQFRTTPWREAMPANKTLKPGIYQQGAFSPLSLLRAP